ncbi:MAG: PEP-CTERM sorting domain-containing protein [Verrucomicrobia bacterium]|nr:PEP-CTERM sorting domain-containing protein [Verrucomicrobiota bacterium]
MKAPAVALAALAVSCAPLPAQIDATWFGGADVWSNPARWSGGVVPSGNFNALINAGTATLDADYAIVGLTLGGTLAGAHTLTTSGLASLGGTISSSTLQANGGITLTSSTSLDGATINNAIGQTFTQSTTGAVLSFGNDAVVNNAGTFNAQNDGGFSPNGGTGNAFFNTGVFNRTTSTGTFSVSNVAFHNAGTVNVQSGTLALLGGGSSTGAFNVSSGATLRLSGATFAAGSSVNGAGTFEISGTLRVSGNTSLSSGNTSLLGGIDFTAPGATATVSSLNLAGDLQGPGTLRLAGIGRIPTGLSLFISTSTLQIDSGRSLTHAGNTVFLTAGARIQNAGTLVATSDGSVSGTGAGGSIVNASSGTFSRTTGTGTFTIGSGVAFDNQGTVGVAAGTLSFNGSVAQFSAGTLTGGTWIVNGAASSATLNGSAFGAGITTNAATVQLVGAGASFASLAPLTSNSGVLSLQAGATFTTVGSLTNPGSLLVQTGAVFTTNGNLANTGAVAITTGSTVNVSGTYSQTAGLTAVFGPAGRLVSPNVQISGGDLAGAGIVQGNVSVSGTGRVTPGDSSNIGILTVQGTHAQTGGSFLLQLGRSPGPVSDLLTVTGTLSLTSTTLNLTRLGAAPLQLGDTFTVLHSDTALSFSGLTLSLDATLASYAFDTSASDAQNLRLTVISTSVPEPSTAWLVASALSGALAWRRVRRGKTACGSTRK